MGLDAVELILRAEEEFNITIEDSEAERVRTGRFLPAHSGQTRREA